MNANWPALATLAAVAASLGRYLVLCASGA